MTKFNTLVVLLFLVTSCYVPEELTTYYRDKDGDGYGNESVTVASTQRPDGYVVATEIFDCDDNNRYIHPYRTEIKHGSWADIDANCNGSLEN